MVAESDGGREIRREERANPEMRTRILRNSDFIHLHVPIGPRDFVLLPSSSHGIERNETSKLCNSTTAATTRRGVPPPPRSDSDRKSFWRTNFQYRIPWAKRMLRGTRILLILPACIYTDAQNATDTFYFCVFLSRKCSPAPTFASFVLRPCFFVHTLNDEDTGRTAHNAEANAATCFAQERCAYVRRMRRVVTICGGDPERTIKLLAERQLRCRFSSCSACIRSRATLK